MPSSKPLPLQGIRVVDFTTAWAGPVCTMVLTDMGAEVIKIESEAHPDVSRRLIVFADKVRGLNRSGYFAMYNRGKKDCLLDLTKPEAVDVAKRLVGISDVVVENFAPRAMKNLGLDYSVLREVKPDIIMLSLSGYGASGPEKDYLAYGATLESYTSLSYLTGYPGSRPQAIGMPISDQIGGLLGAFAILAALCHRDVTGKGQYIDLSEAEALASILPEAIMEYTMNGTLRSPSGNRDDMMAPHDCYKCRGEDKWVAIAVETDEEWCSLCQVMSRSELIADERFHDVLSRLKNQDELDRLISEWTANQTNIEVMEQLQQAGVAAGPVYNAEEIFRDPHLRARCFITEINHPEVGKRELPGLLAKLSETPGDATKRDPLFGEHTEWVLNELLAND